MRTTKKVSTKRISAKKIAKKKNLLVYSKVLFIISIALVIYGLILDFSSELGILDPVKDVNIINEEDNTINITQTTIEEKVQENVSDNALVNDKINDALRTSIEKKYSVVILYNEETEGYRIANMDTEKITDPVIINEQLTKLDNALSKYPKGMFKEINKGGIPLTIYLINNYSERTITGITDSSNQYANISIAAIYPFEESFYHESYHYIERYMLKKGANFNSWDSLNPSNFTWNTVNGNLSYDMTHKDNSPFVNNYAQTSAAEDRASTFEYMMTSIEPSCFQDKNNTIWKKANYMAMTIETVFNSVSPDITEYWERWLKND